MSKQPYRRWVTLGRHYARLLQLDDFNIITVKDNIKQDDEDDFPILATTVVDGASKQAHIAVDSKRLRTVTDRQMKNVACHEMVHIVLSPISDLVNRMEGSLPEPERAGWHGWYLWAEERVAAHIGMVIRQMEHT